MVGAKMPHFGWGEKKSMAAVTQVANQFNVLAIQELINTEAITALEKMLEETTGK